MKIAIATALSGTLERRPDGWYWKDGQKEPRVTDLLLRHVAPNFRCITYGDARTYVEIPHDWASARHWPNGRSDSDVRAAIREIIQHSSTVQAPIYAEGLAELIDDHRLTKSGWRAPIESWDALMNQPCGATWLQADQPTLLEKARTLGWEG